MTKKNPHAVALGRRGGKATSPRKASTSAANGARSGGRPPAGVSRPLWRQVLERRDAIGLTTPELYTKLFERFLKEGI